VTRVPYAGFKGDYQSIPVLTAGGFGFPLLGRPLGGGNYDVAGPDPTFTMAEGDIPAALVHLDHQVRELRIEVRDATTGRQWHRAFDLEYLPRNSTSTGFFAFEWDGMTTRGRGSKTQVVPNGSYVLELQVLKALGVASNPDHWETWTSPPFTVARP
jgi:minor extracellular serine protease Vpr